MKIQEGKRYVRRDGVVTGKIKLDPDDMEGYPFNDPESGFDYTKTGKYWRDGVTCEYDLVCEYIPTS